MLAGGLAGGESRGVGIWGGLRPLARTQATLWPAESRSSQLIHYPSGKGEKTSSLPLFCFKKPLELRGQLAGRSLPTPGPCPVAASCAATGEDSVSAAES